MKFSNMVDVCEDNYEFNNQRRKPVHLVAPLLASYGINFSINRALLNSGHEQIIPCSDSHIDNNMSSLNCEDKNKRKTNKPPFERGELKNLQLL